MIDLTVFSYREAIRCILDFYTIGYGVWKFDLDENSIVRKFIEMNMTSADGDHEELIVLSLEGDAFLQEYIDEISQQFIKYMKSKGCKSLSEDICEWYENTFDLDSEEESCCIASYIFSVLYRYDYRVKIGRSTSKDGIVYIEKII